MELNWPASLACTTKDNSVKEVVSHHLRSVIQNVSYIHRRRLQFFKANDHVAFEDNTEYFCWTPLWRRKHESCQKLDIN